MDPIELAVREALVRHGRLGVDAMALQTDESLYEAGMNSQCSVNVMLALEAHFDLEFPDEMLNRDVFGSIRGMASALRQITVS